MYRSLIVRFLVTGLALSAVTFFSTRYCHASPATDGARGRAVFRMQGGALFRDRGYSDGAGWIAGGAVGFGVARDLLVMANVEHIAVQISRPYRESFQPITLHLEMGAPFQHRIAPRIDLGAGVYVRARDHFTPYYYYDPHGLGRTTAPFGMSFGGGLSFLMARTVMLDVGVRRHESFDPNESWGMTTLDAGLTFALGREEPGPNVWTRSGREGGKPAAYASR